MREHPILFSTEMVQAILEGRKTQTRRIIKHGQSTQPKHCQIAFDLKLVSLVACLYNSDDTNPFTMDFELKGGMMVKFPYGKHVGLDYKNEWNLMLWVRETFADAMGDYAYKADYSEEVLNEERNKGLWKPSIHMPKKAARIWLRITNIRVERLHEITEEDAVKEGAAKGRVLGHGQIGGSHREGFIELWESINGWDSWMANPWVWVIEFEVASTTGRP